MNRRRGFTLVELIVVALLFSVIVGLAMEFFTTGQQHSRKLGFQLQALQSAQLLRERLFQDLASHSPAAPGQAPFSGAQRLSFLRVTSRDGRGVLGTSLDGDGNALCEQVTYEFDPGQHQVRRTCEGRTEVLHAGRFQDVSFSYAPFGTEDGRGETIGVTVVAVPEDLLDHPDRVDPRTQRVEQSFSFHCPQTTLRRVYREWSF